MPDFTGRNTTLKMLLKKVEEQFFISFVAYQLHLASKDPATPDSLIFGLRP